MSAKTWTSLTRLILWALFLQLNHSSTKSVQCYILELLAAHQRRILNGPWLGLLVYWIDKRWLWEKKQVSLNEIIILLFVGKSETGLALNLFFRYDKEFPLIFSLSWWIFESWTYMSLMPIFWSVGDSEIWNWGTSLSSTGKMFKWIFPCKCESRQHELCH